MGGDTEFHSHTGYSTASREWRLYKRVPWDRGVFPHDVEKVLDPRVSAACVTLHDIQQAPLSMSGAVLADGSERLHRVEMDLLQGLIMFHLWYFCPPTVFQ